MIEVTPQAKACLAERLEKGQTPNPVDSCFRLERAGEQSFSLVRGDPKDDDVTFQHEDDVVLAMDSQIADALDGAALDVEEKEGAPDELVLVPSSSEGG